tara:strand:+ start:2263 stop:2772 length:510 start_codon:yes stop_codon:yes gene_type:complete
MQRFGSIVKNINRRINKMQNVETFECSHKKAFASKEGNGKYSIYVTKDDGTDMTIYGEAVGAEGWSKGSRLKITAAPPRQSKNGKWYQTAQSVEMLDGQVATSVPIPSVAPAASKPVDKQSQWKEKYRLTMSNLLSASLQSGKEVNFDQIDKYVRMILDAQYDGDEAPF